MVCLDCYSAKKNKKNIKPLSKINLDFTVKFSLKSRLDSKKSFLVRQMYYFNKFRPYY